MLEGLVQHDHPLTLLSVLQRMRTINGDREVVTLEPAGSRRATYGALGERVDRLCRGLEELGVRPGDRVATFAWNSQEHLELYLGVPCMGAVLHTLNFRLAPEQLAYIVNHAQDVVIAVDDVLVPLLAPLQDRLTSVRHYVVLGSGDASALAGAIRYDDLLATQSPGYAYPQLDDRSAAGLCYTGGTTGDPKGVLYSHRSNVLQTVTECMPDLLNLSGRDRVLPIVPMFHANAWGLPYCCALTGASMLMPREHMQPHRLAGFIEQERATIAGAVPTVWMDLLRYADEHRPDLSSLRTVLCGGSAVPLSLSRAFQERHGAEIVQCWGMTEMSPLGAVARPPAGVEGEAEWEYRDRAGRLAALLQARVVDDDGIELPWDGQATGELQVRGPWVASAYYESDQQSAFIDGWLRTGD
ncbi:MAG TPA: AMP-binding protein, partial [Baekduia sp.]|nr:AMP-binding protein [Baekduia sp.]